MTAFTQRWEGSPEKAQSLLDFNSTSEAIYQTLRAVEQGGSKEGNFFSFFFSIFF